MKQRSLLKLLLLFVFFGLMFPNHGHAGDIGKAYLFQDKTEQNYSLLAYTNRKTFSYRVTPAQGAKTASLTPTIRFVLEAEQLTVESMKLYLDQQFVTSNYNEENQTIEYEPDQSLDSGSHEIKVKVTFRGYETSTITSSFTILEDLINPFSGKDLSFLNEQEDKAIQKLNDFRQDLGLPLFNLNQDLSKSAQAHSNYFILNNRNTAHDEISGLPGFTGEAPWQRTEYFGYTGYVGEGISYDKTQAWMGVDDLMDAPYHRLSIINPNYREVGIGFNFIPDEINSTVVNYGTTALSLKQDQVVLYPYPNQQDAKAGWFVAENPNPLEAYQLDRIFVGYPISMSLHDANTKELKFVSATLTNESGEAVPYYKVHSAMEENQKKHIFLIPKDTLELGETYHVRIEAIRILKDGSTEEIDRRWSFSTQKEVKVMNMNIVHKNDREYLNVRLENGDIADLTIELSQNGKTYQTFNSGGKGYYRSYDSLKNGEYIVKLESSLFPKTYRYQVDISGVKGKRFLEWGELSQSEVKLIPQEVNVFPKQENVSAYKQWTVKLNTKLSSVSAQDQFVYVTDSYGTKQNVNVRLSSDSSHLIISPPNEGYSAGGTYYLYIDKGIRSLNNETMLKTTVMKFTIKE